jgi:hypothetical protein
MAAPVVLVPTGGAPVSQSTIGAPLTPVTSGGVPVTIVASGGVPVTFVAAEGGTTYETETYALLGRMTVQPSTTRMGQINTLITALKTAGVWAKLAGCGSLAEGTQQASLLDWTSGGHDLTAFNSPTFTANRGVTGNGTTSSVDYSATTGATWSPALATQNSSHYGLWTRTAATYGGGGIDLYAGAGFMSRRATTNPAHYTVRVNAAGSTNVAVAGVTGFFIGARADASNQRLYRNGALVTSAAVASSAAPDRLQLLHANGASYSDAEASWWSIGADLTDQNVADYYTALNTYMTAIGAA